MRNPIQDGQRLFPVPTIGGLHHPFEYRAGSVSRIPTFQWDAARLLHAASWFINLDDVIHDLINRRARHTVAHTDRLQHSIPLRHNVVPCFSLAHCAAVRR
ncbi:MAG TPA: hypothetical protein VJM47_10630 [Nitrosospira sp.]|nr:hypothetical protein [Nitrosospira sp.]